MIRLYSAAGSCSICSHIALIEAELPHEVQHVVLRSPKSPLPAHNPLGKVPTIVVDDSETITQSMVVLPYIADQAPESGLLPPIGTAERRRALQWLSFLNSDVHPALKMVGAAERFCADPDSLRDSYRPIVANYFRLVDDALSGRDWLVGDRMTIADIYAAVAFNWAVHFGMPLDSYPAFRRLSVRFEALPSTLRARAMDAEFVAASMKRLVFLSPEWLEMAADELTTAIAIDVRSQRLRCSVIERYVEVPDDAPQPDHAAPGLWLEIDKGVVASGYGIRPGMAADFEIERSYADAWKSVCQHNGPNLDAFNAERIGSGRLKLKGTPGEAGPLLKRIHDRIADRTVAPPVDD